MREHADATLEWSETRTAALAPEAGGDPGTVGPIACGNTVCRADQVCSAGADAEERVYVLTDDGSAEVGHEPVAETRNGRPLAIEDSGRRASTMNVSRGIGGLVFGFVSASLLALACGGSSDARAGADARDGAADTTTGTPADGVADAAPEVVDGAPNDTKPRCAGASYATAPSGAACDPKHIEAQRGLEGSCYGPPIGAFCRSFQVSVPAGQEGALPPGFVCGSAELGAKTCAWSFGDDASTHAIDDDALEAACAATIAFPTATVLCANSGS